MSWHSSLIKFSVLTALLLASLSVHGALELYVQESLTVYAKPSRRAKVISRLARGDKLLISPKKYGAWRKVLVTYRGKKVGGYVRSSQIQRSYIESQGSQKAEESRNYSHGYGLGVSAVGSFLRQGEREVSTDSGDTFEISSLEGTTLYFAVFGDMPLDRHWALRGFLSFRKTDFKGDAENKTGLGSGNNASLQVEQSLLGVGAQLKYYPTPFGHFWYGLGFEAAKGTSADVVLTDQIPIRLDDEDEEDLPFFMIPSVGVGLDVPASKKIFLVPEARLGMVVNGDPMTLVGEVLVSGAYAW